MAERLRNTERAGAIEVPPRRDGGTRPKVVGGGYAGDEGWSAGHSTPTLVPPSSAMPEAITR
ncbi:hypothetical protein [Mycobacterium sp. 050134]|uniref:hypothetical protein n=1 Tax=Mycobacterium sp. 050134 TaxID=3096111 RepID=UPI002EDAA73E